MKKYLKQKNGFHIAILVMVYKGLFCSWRCERLELPVFTKKVGNICIYHKVIHHGGFIFYKSLRPSLDCDFVCNAN